MAFAVNAAEVATPLALVVAVFTPPANVPVAPVAGAEKVTVAPLTGFELASSTVATNGSAKAVLIAALCPAPLVGVIEAEPPAILVKLKLAGVETPATEALTV